jgi:hypothetical protein
MPKVRRPCKNCQIEESHPGDDDGDDGDRGGAPKKGVYTMPWQSNYFTVLYIIAVDCRERCEIRSELSMRKRMESVTMFVRLLVEDMPVLWPTPIGRRVWSRTVLRHNTLREWTSLSRYPDASLLPMFTYKLIELVVDVHMQLQGSGGGGAGDQDDTHTQETVPYPVAIPRMYTEMVRSPKQWGPHFWFFFKHIAAWLGHNGHTSTLRTIEAGHLLVTYFAMFTRFLVLLPCVTCRGHMATLLKTLPAFPDVKHMGSAFSVGTTVVQDAALAWVVQAYTTQKEQQRQQQQQPKAHTTAAAPGSALGPWTVKGLLRVLRPSTTLSLLM